MELTIMVPCKNGEFKRTSQKIDSDQIQPTGNWWGWEHLGAHVIEEEDVDPEDAWTELGMGGATPPSTQYFA